MVHVYVDAKNFKWYLEDKLFEAHTKDLKKPGDIHISIPREWILQHFPIEDGVLFVVDPKKKRLEIDFSPLLGEIYITYQDNVNRYHPYEFGLTTDDLINMPTEELKKHIEKKWREMK